MFWVGAHLAGGLTPFLVNSLLEAGFGWRTIFVMFGSLGFVWAYVWWKWFRDTPEEHRAVSDAERAYIAAGRPPFEQRDSTLKDWKRLLANRTSVGLCLLYFTQSFGGAFYVTWLPRYFAERGLSGRTAAILAGLPLIFSAVADLLGGVTTDALRGGSACAPAAPLLCWLWIDPARPVSGCPRADLGGDAILPCSDSRRKP